MSDSLLYKDKSTMLFHVYHNWWEQGVVSHAFVSKDYNENTFYKKGNFVMFNNKRIIIANNLLAITNKYNKERMKVDYIILSGNTKLKISNLLSCFECDNFIIDSSNSFYKARKWQKDCEKAHIKCFNVLQKGACVLNI